MLKGTMRGILVTGGATTRSALWDNPLCTQASSIQLNLRYPKRIKIKDLISVQIGSHVMGQQSPILHPGYVH